VLVTLAAAAVPLLAGCGAAGHPASADASSSATVVTRSFPGYGTALATPAGEALYVFTSDPDGGSACTARCTAMWHPYRLDGKPTAGSGVNPSLLSTFRRSDGSEQVLYRGHALYTYTGLGEAGGAGVTADGGVWFLISPAGKPIEQTTGSGY
jgi:predicted lipoprotein with Yx(FWY)xxD motif